MCAVEAAPHAKCTFAYTTVWLYFIHFLIKRNFPFAILAKSFPWTCWQLAVHANGDAARPGLIGKRGDIYIFAKFLWENCAEIFSKMLCAFVCKNFKERKLELSPLDLQFNLHLLNSFAFIHACLHFNFNADNVRVNTAQQVHGNCFLIVLI